MYMEGTFVLLMICPANQFMCRAQFMSEGTIHVAAQQFIPASRLSVYRNLSNTLK